MNDSVDAIMTIMERAFPARFGEAWNRRQLTDSLAFPTTHFFLVDPFGNPPVNSMDAVGFFLSRAAPDEEELLLVAVQPEYRSQGLGSKLIRQFMQDAQTRGAKRLFLEMRANNPAHRLYESMGFAPIGSRKGYYTLSNGSRIDAISFRLELAP